jgi:hypothetical protein
MQLHQLNVCVWVAVILEVVACFPWVWFGVGGAWEMMLDVGKRGRRWEILGQMSQDCSHFLVVGTIAHQPRRFFFF